MNTSELRASLELWERRERAAHHNHLHSAETGDHRRERLWIDREREAERMIVRRQGQLEQRGKPWAPPIVGFHADYQYVFGAKGPVYRAAGHYTAGERCAGARELLAEATADHRYHVGKGWGGLSYEWMIADDGTLLLGNPTGRKSAAVALNNTGMVNVCMPGTTGDRPTAAQQRTLRWLLAHAHTRALPRQHRSPVDLRTIPLRGHRDWPSQSTACPGNFSTLYRTRGADR